MQVLHYCMAMTVGGQPNLPTMFQRRSRMNVPNAYIYNIYIKFTEASHHNTLNMTQNRWM